MTRERVLVALSGGVDSSVAALLLTEQGYDVHGVFLRNGVEAPLGSCRPRQGCCSAEDARDAALVADRLGIPFHALDMEEEFLAVQRAFRRSYAQGSTPNPCMLCNRDIKFGALLRLADLLEARWLATGHYARIHTVGKRRFLARARDPHKDQSYVLFPIGPAALERSLFPLGELRKDATRARAAAAGLRVSAKPDSQEICFVPSGDYRDYLRAHGGLGRPGRFLDLQGRVLGEHDGTMAFTRGQRRGLGIASTEALYVVDLRPESGDVILGPRSATACSSATVEGFLNYGEPLLPGGAWEDLEIQFHSSPGGVPGRLLALDEGRVRVQFETPAHGVSPGQGLVAYRGERLLGGGWIAAVDLPALTGTSV